MSADEVVLRRGRRRVALIFLVEVALVAVGVLLLATAIKSGPLDYRYHPFLAAQLGLALLPLVLVSLAGRLFAAHRVAVVLSPAGIGTRRPGPVIAWSDVQCWRIVRGWTGRLVEITLRGGVRGRRRRVLAAPVGRLRRSDPAFEAAVATFGEWAARHGVEAAPPRRVPRRGLVAVTLVGTLLVAAAAVRVVQSGVIWPWTPTAAHAATACPALDAAGLAQYWPEDLRKRNRDDVDHTPFGEWSYCGWTPADGHFEDAPYLWMTAVVRLNGTYGGSSPIAVAIQLHNNDRQSAGSYRNLCDVGEQAFVVDRGDRIQVAGRRANVTVSIEVWPNRTGFAISEFVARDLAAKILAAVRTD